MTIRAGRAASTSARLESRLGAGDCERLRDGLVAQPVNTATSLGYVAAAAAMLGRTGRGERSGLAVLFAGLLASVGMGSVAYHGPQPLAAKPMHDVPIVGVLGLIPLVLGARQLVGQPVLPGWSRERGLALAGLTTAGASAYLAGRTESRVCDPDSGLQWHGAWHVLSAAALLAAGHLMFAPAAKIRTGHGTV